jgi:hypothetical protein
LNFEVIPPLIIHISQTLIVYATISHGF